MSYADLQLCRDDLVMKAREQNKEARAEEAHFWEFSAKALVLR